MDHGRHLARLEIRETKESPTVVRVPASSGSNIVEEDPVDPTGESVFITAVRASPDQPGLVRVCGSRTSVPGHFELLARPEGDAQPVFGDSPVVGGDMRIQQVNGCHEAEVQAVPVVPEPTGRIRRNAGQVNEYLQIARRVVRRVDRHVQVSCLGKLDHSRTPDKTHQAVANVASVPEEADQREGIRTPEIGEPSRQPG